MKQNGSTVILVVGGGGKAVGLNEKDISVITHNDLSTKFFSDQKI